MTLTVESDGRPADAEAPLTFHVVDTGIGISEEDRRLLFQRFARLDVAASSGFGLGLAITRELAELMDGDVTMESREGEGSRFSLRLPVADCADWAREKRAYETSGPIPLPALPALRGSVLIAEDSRSLRDLCRQMLARWGLYCETAGNGREAVERTRHRRFDVILMDWQMPELDGLEATLRLRRDGVDTPIVALTAAAMSGDREKCLAAGCNEYLTKPIDWKELHRLLAALLRVAAEAAPRTLPRTDVAADEEIADLARAYVRGLPDKVAALRASLSVDDWQPFHTALHRLVGTVGTYGLQEVYRAAEELERISREEDLEAATAGLAKLAAVVGRTAAKLGK